MSSSTFIFAVYDASTGAPKTGYAASLSFVAYKDETGANVATPTITEVGGGLYKFTPVFTAGHVIGFILGTTGANPGYIFGSLRAEDFGATTTPSPTIVFFPVYDATTGAPKVGVTCSFVTYDDDVGTPVTPPTITEVGSGLYKFTPVFGTRSIAYVLSTGGNLPPRQSGFLRPEDFVSSGFIATGATAFPNQIVVSFATGYTLDAISGAAAVPANWVVTGPTSVTVTAVTLTGNQVVLTTTNQLNGGAYSVTVPAGITAGGGANALLGPSSLSFTGVAGDPTAVMARDVDERLVDVYFSFPPVAARALDPTQYSISPTLAVVSVKQVTSVQYRLTTGPQTTGQVYALTWPTH